MISMLLGKRKRCDGDRFFQSFSLIARVKLVKRYCRYTGAGQLFYSTSLLKNALYELHPLLQ
jgi:hypothetical protein